MSDKIKPVSRVGRATKLRKIKLRLFNRKAMDGSNFKDILSTAYDKKSQNGNIKEESKTEERINDEEENHFIDTLC